MSATVRPTFWPGEGSRTRPPRRAVPFGPGIAFVAVGDAGGRMSARPFSPTPLKNVSRDTPSLSAVRSKARTPASKVLSSIRPAARAASRPPPVGAGNVFPVKPATSPGRLASAQTTRGSPRTSRKPAPTRRDRPVARSRRQAGLALQVDRAADRPVRGGVVGMEDRRPVVARDRRDRPVGLQSSPGRAQASTGRERCSRTKERKSGGRTEERTARRRRLLGGIPRWSARGTWPAARPGRANPRGSEMT